MIARMRLLLADVSARQEQVQQLRRQLRGQTEKVIQFSVYGDATVDTTLAMMADLQERMDQAEKGLTHLETLKRRLEAELESLQLTRGVEAAKAELAEAQAQIVSAVAGSDQPTRDDLAKRIHELQQQINEASERAARTIGRRPDR